MRQMYKKSPPKVLGGDLETDNDGATAWIVQSSITDGVRWWHDTDVDGIRKTFTRLMWNYGNIIIYKTNKNNTLTYKKP